MKKIGTWSVAIITSLVSLAAMLVFDYILAWIYYLMGKVPFLTDVIEGIGEVADLGLTALVAVLIAHTIWAAGNSLIRKIDGEALKDKNTPLYHTNNAFLLVAIAVFVFVGYHFFRQIGGTVITYTSDPRWFAKILLFFEAIKDTFLTVRAEHILIYKIGWNSFVLAVIAMFNPVEKIK